MEIIFGIGLGQAILIAFVAWILYDWIKAIIWRIQYNVKGPFPLPIFGNFLEAFKRSQIENDDYVTKTYGPVSGGSFGAIRSVHVADMELLKKLMVKDHLKFQNRFSIPGMQPSPLDMLLLDLRDSHWKRVRSILTPSYSPGKIKMMTQEIKYAAGNLVSSLHEKAETGEPVDTKFHFGCFTMDVIAGTAFGIRTNAYKNPDQPFISLAKSVFGQDPLKNPLLVIALLFPRIGIFLNKCLNISIFYPLNALRFFTKLIKDIMADRKEKLDSSRNDLLQLMMNDWEENQDVDPNHTSKKLTTNELLAQGFLVFIAGYETTATLLTFMTYALAMHPDVQDKLIEEIDSFIKTDEDMTYDKVMEMPYLDQVVCETLRKYPPLAKMNRMPSEDQDIEIDGYKFAKGTLISYSIWQIHHQLGFYPEPEKFDPDRFSPEEKQKRDPFTFIPFGHGPRNCIGMRLALLEAKVGIVEVLRKVKFTKIPETEEELELIVHTFTSTKNPVKLGVVRRYLRLPVSD